MPESAVRMDVDQAWRNVAATDVDLLDCRMCRANSIEPDDGTILYAYAPAEEAVKRMVAVIQAALVTRIP